MTTTKQIMRLKSSYHVTLFMALAMLLAISCSHTPKKIAFVDDQITEWNATVDKTIAEPERAAKLKQLGRQLVDVASSIQQDVAEYNKQLMLLNEDYNATHEQLQQDMEAFSTVRNTKFGQYRDIIFAMRGEVSADEWKALTK